MKNETEKAIADSIKKQTEINKIVEKINEMKTTQEIYSERVDAIRYKISNNKIVSNIDYVDATMARDGYSEEIQKIEIYINKKFQEMGKLYYNHMA